MPASGPPRPHPLVALLERSYRLMLHAYPAPFRRASGREMAEVFQDMCNHELHTHGIWGVFRLGLGILRSTPRHGLAERLIRRRAITALHPSGAADGLPREAGAQPPSQPSASKGDPSVFVILSDHGV